MKREMKFILTLDSVFNKEMGDINVESTMIFSLNFIEECAKISS